MEEYVNKIIQGDCLEVLRTLPSESVDCVITSPPYNKGGKDRQKNRSKTFPGIAKAMAEQWGAMKGQSSTRGGER